MNANVKKSKKKAKVEVVATPKIVDFSTCVAIRDQIKRKARDIHKSILENPINKNTSRYPGFKEVIQITIAADKLVFENRVPDINDTPADIAMVVEEMEQFLFDIIASIKKTRSQMYQLKKKMGVSK